MVEFILMAALAAGTGLPAFAAEVHQFDIPEEAAPAAIRDFGAQAHVQILAAGENVKDKRLNAVSGAFTTEDGLNVLLAGSGLSHKYVGDHSIALVTASNSNSAATQPAAQDQTGSSKSSSGDSLRLAQATPGQAASSVSVGNVQSGSQENSNQPYVLQEVIVTAQKKAEREQDVPIAMTVLDPQTLAENGQSRLVDYFSSVPGLSLAGGTITGGLNYLTIRGLSAGFYQNPTVATVIDDVPVGSSSILAWGSMTQPDLDPSDLARIEVLKGPQGTLYGADSLGGLVKYVTADPSTSAFTARAEVGGTDIPDGGAGYTVRGAANIPLSDTLALRVSGFDRRDPGYIDDLTTGQTNVNSADVYGGHLSLLYRPLEDFSVKLGALIQNTDGNGAGYVNSNNLGQFVQGDLVHTGTPGTGKYQTQWQLYAATLNAKVAGIDVVSVTGYNTNFVHSADDLGALGYFSGVSHSVFPGACGVGACGIYIAEHFYTEKFSQEMRLSSSEGHWLDWMVGGFYTHEVSPGSESYQQDPTVYLSTGAPVAALATAYYPTTLTEYAAFGDLTFHVTNRFDVQIGGRQSWDTQHYDDINVGPGVPAIYGKASPDVVPPEYAKGTPFTYLVTPKYAISSGLQVYARIASGYRIGGPNELAGAGSYPVPTYYQPDKTLNYEVGVKGDVFDHLLSFDAAAYYIKWTDFQLNVKVATPDGTNSFTTNAGNAKSEGVEFSLEAHPVGGLTLGFQGSYSNAVLTQDLPPTAVAAGAYGLAGDRLPYSIKVSGGFTANEDIRLSNDWIGFIGGAVNYVGARPEEFAGGPPPYTPDTQRTELPAYTQVNLRTGARNQSWLVNLYVNNVTDKRALVGIYQNGQYLGNTGGAIANVVQPRTIGLNVSKSF